MREQYRPLRALWPRTNRREQRRADERLLSRLLGPPAGQSPGRSGVGRVSTTGDSQRRVVAWPRTASSMNRCGVAYC